MPISLQPERRSAQEDSNLRRSPVRAHIRVISPAFLPLNYAPDYQVSGTRTHLSPLSRGTFPSFQSFRWRAHAVAGCQKTIRHDLNYLGERIRTSGLHVPNVACWLGYTTPRKNAGDRVCTCTGF